MARFGIGDSLDWDDRLLLLGEDDPAVEEGRDDVLHDEVHLGLAHLVEVLVEIGPEAGREVDWNLQSWAKVSLPQL